MVESIASGVLIGLAAAGGAFLGLWLQDRFRR